MDCHDWLLKSLIWVSFIRPPECGGAVAVVCAPDGDSRRLVRAFARQSSFSEDFTRKIEWSSGPVRRRRQFFTNVHTASTSPTCLLHGAVLRCRKSVEYQARVLASAKRDT
jgi:hypothetical protein